MNYLPDAWNHGAEIYTRMSVRWIERNEKTGKWLVFVQPMDLGRERFSSPPMFITADTVFLGAGSLGSTEILIRSAQKGLALSGQLGAGFTSNGDVLGFGYNCDQPINTLGRANRIALMMQLCFSSSELTMVSELIIGTSTPRVVA